MRTTGRGALVALGAVLLVAWADAGQLGAGAVSAYVQAPARIQEPPAQFLPPVPTLRPTATFLPTLRPIATLYRLPTRIPTSSLLATATPRPTDTPLPTATPGPILAVPRPPERLPEPSFAPGALPELPEVAALYAAPGVGADLPPGAACLRAANVRPLGLFTGYSFELEVPAATGDCLVPGGLVLRSPDGRQDLLVMGTAPVTFAGEGPATVRVYANSLDVSKPGPRPGAPYAIAGLVTADSALARLVSVLPDVPPEQVTVVGLQAAVWAITNDLPAPRVASLLPVAPEDLASARLLLERAGVDPASRALFRGE